MERVFLVKKDGQKQVQIVTTSEEKEWSLEDDEVQETMLGRRRKHWEEGSPLYCRPCCLSQLEEQECPCVHVQTSILVKIFHSGAVGDLSF